MRLMNRRFAAFAACALGFGVLAPAQDVVLTAHGPWTLQQCIDHALENNISIRQTENDLKAKEVAVLAAKGDMLPSVSGGVSESFSFGRSIGEDNIYTNANTSSTGINLGADVSVFGGLRKLNTLKQSQIELKASDALLQNAKNKIRVSVTEAFVTILYDKSIVELAREQLQKDSLQMERLSQMMQCGKASSSEVSAQRSTFYQSKLSLTQALNNLNLDVLNLTQLLEIWDPTGFDIVSPEAATIDVMPVADPVKIYDMALKMRPEVAADSLRLLSAGYQVKIAKAGYMPTLNLSGGLGTNYYTNSNRSIAPFADQMRNNFNQYVGLTLSIPIFNRLQTMTAVRKSEISAKNQALALESTRKALYKEIQQAWVNAVNSQSKFVSSREAAASAKESFDLTVAKYDAGKADINEYNTSRTQYLSAASELQKARYEMLFNVRLLEFYASGELEL